MVKLTRRNAEKLDDRYDIINYLFLFVATNLRGARPRSHEIHMRRLFFMPLSTLVTALWPHSVILFAILPMTRATGYRFLVTLPVILFGIYRRIRGSMLLPMAVIMFQFGGLGRMKILWSKNRRQCLR